jgi:predicted DsbA family dithiol-disulfide isomerase
LSCGLLVLVGLVMIRATCDKGRGAAAANPPGSSSADAATEVGLQPSSSAGEGQTPAVGVAKAPEVVTGVPGMDFTTLPLSAQKELNQVLSDEFCYCGCPHSLGACLREHRGCHHARRMALLAAREAAAGAPSVEISVMLSKYYLSFRERRQTFKIDPRMCIGPSDAKVTFMEFSDFECPYCNAARPVLEKFVKESTPKVRLCFAPFPLPAHPHAIQAAQAALYARDHGKFWPMHDALFEKQTQLSDETIRGLAEKLGMSGADLGKALDSYRGEVEGSKELGVNAGVDATPTIFVNGRKLSLLISPEVLSVTVQDELEWTNNHNAWVVD